MHPTVTLLAALLFATALQACTPWNCEKGSGTVIKQTLTVAAFQGIAAQGSLEVQIHRATTQKVEVEGQANLIALITTEVKNGIWEIRTKKCFSTKERLIVHVSLPMIDQVTVQGSGNVQSSDAFLAQDFEAVVQGSGGLDMIVDAKRMNLLVQGSGDIELKGSCGALTAAAQGSGDIRAAGVITTNATASVAGSGDITVHATQDLNANIAGSGDILYKGEPTNLNKNVAGSGVVKPQP